MQIVLTSALLKFQWDRDNSEERRLSQSSLRDRIEKEDWGQM